MADIADILLEHLRRRPKKKYALYLYHPSGWYKSCCADTVKELKAEQKHISVKQGKSIQFKILRVGSPLELAMAKADTEQTRKEITTTRI